MRNPWCVAVALLLVASTVAAETVLEREGELASGDPVLEDGRPVDWLRVSLASGTRYLFRVASDEIDTSLILRFADGATLANDDFDGSDPALLYSALRAETVEVGVTTSSASEGGPYTLTVQTLAAARSVQTGLKGSRTLGPESAVDIGDGERWFADSVLLTGARGDRVTVRLGSSDFDAYLRVQSRDGYAEENDDARNTTDAQIRYVFAQRGQIEVIVRSTSPSEGGEYALSIEREGTAASIDLGRPVSGRIAEGSVQYLLEGKKGQAAIVSLRSETFDPLLEIVDRAGRKSANDDYGDGTDSQLHYLFPEDGTVTVSVTRQDSGEAGSFRLSAEPVHDDRRVPRGGEPPPRPEVRPSLHLRRRGLRARQDRDDFGELRRIPRADGPRGIRGERRRQPGRLRRAPRNRLPHCRRVLRVRLELQRLGDGILRAHLRPRRRRGAAHRPDRQARAA